MPTPKVAGDKRLFKLQLHFHFVARFRAPHCSLPQCLMLLLITHACYSHFSHAAASAGLDAFYRQFDAAMLIEAQARH